MQLSGGTSHAQQSLGVTATQNPRAAPEEAAAGQSEVQQPVSRVEPHTETAAAASAAVAAADQALIDMFEEEGGPQWDDAHAEQLYAALPGLRPHPVDDPMEWDFNNAMAEDVPLFLAAGSLPAAPDAGFSAAVFAANQPAAGQTPATQPLAAAAAPLAAVAAPLAAAARRRKQACPRSRRGHRGTLPAVQHAAEPASCTSASESAEGSSSEPRNASSHHEHSA